MKHDERGRISYRDVYLEGYSCFIESIAGLASKQSNVFAEIAVPRD